MSSVDAFVSASFGMAGHKGFEAGKSGVFIVLPAGDEMQGRSRRWKRFAWYTPRAREAQDGLTGNWRFLADGATPANKLVENWYELLDSWFDPDPDDTGGVNEYRW